MKHTYLLLEDGKLWVYQSDSEMPVFTYGFDNPKYHLLLKSHEHYLNKWKKSAKSAPVHETQEDKFIEILRGIYGDSKKYWHLSFKEACESGIKLPDGLVGVVHYCNIYQSFNPLKCTECKCEKYVFLVEKPVEKEDSCPGCGRPITIVSDEKGTSFMVEKEEGLWPSDEVINNLFPVNYEIDKDNTEQFVINLENELCRSAAKKIETTSNNTIT
jgi:hypothetical protein